MPALPCYISLRRLLSNCSLLSPGSLLVYVPRICVYLMGRSRRGLMYPTGYRPTMRTLRNTHTSHVLCVQSTPAHTVTLSHGQIRGKHPESFLFIPTHSATSIPCIASTLSTSSMFGNVAAKVQPTSSPQPLQASAHAGCQDGSRCGAGRQCRRYPSIYGKEPLADMCPMGS